VTSQCEMNAEVWKRPYSIGQNVLEGRIESVARKTSSKECLVRPT